jgi:hypothetical protein
MKPDVPQLDYRDYKQIVEQALKLARFYFAPAQWSGIDWKSIKEPLNKDDPAYRMLEIFARLMELLIRRLNKIPDKNFLSFLEMVGVEQKTGNPAEVPVTFLPAKTAVIGGDIPAGTQVATTQTDTADAQVFETRNAFYATPAKLKKVISLEPLADKYSQLQPGELPPKPEELADERGAVTAFKSDDPALPDIDHILYIGSEKLFGGKDAVKLILDISLSTGNKSIFNNETLQWKTYTKDNKAWANIEAEVTFPSLRDPNKVEIKINNFTGTDKSDINSSEDFWIACHFTGMFDSAVEIPRVTAISGKILPPGDAETLTTKIDSAFSNNTPVDPSKPIYPFGQRPQYGDAFYIGSKKAFAPDIQSVTLAFTIWPYKDDKLKEIFKNIQKDISLETEIAWEYLDNSGEWQLLSTFKHTLNVQKKALIVTHTYSTAGQDGTFFGIAPNNPGSAPVILDIPQNIGLKELNKQENYWLRARIKTFDPYGKDAWIETTGIDNSPLTVIGPTFIPPIIESMNISYTYKAAPIPVDSIQTRNNFEYILHQEEPSSPAKSFVPFIPITSTIVRDSDPALYLAFDKEFGDGYISMFFHIQEAPSTSGYALEQGNPQIAWEYAAAGYTWKPLDVNDTTADLTASGIVAFTGPTDSIKIPLFNTLFQEDGNPGQELYWYRARLAKNSYNYPPVIKGIYLNTVMADNRVISRQDQVIGSGNGEANQQLSLVRVPITGGQLWVRETEKPTDDELKSHLQDFLTLGENDDLEENDIVEEIETAAGTEENWVQWLKVPTFLVSGPRGRHYTLDAVNGRVTFGDGKNGLKPPVGKDNIIIRDYCTGGGEAANSAAGPLAIKVLKSSLPYVDKVFNVQRAVGGSDPWSLDQTRQFGPQSIKHQGRAVTVEDYEWMVLQQFSQAARAKCIPTRIPSPGGRLSFKPGAVTIIVVPKSRETKPLPSRELLKNIRDYLRQKALGTIFEDIHVIGPGFKKIDISAEVVPQKPGESSMVERRIIKALEDFFHPLTGGEHGEGWAFGRDVYISEIYAVIERVEGVKYVKKAWFTGESQGVESMEIESNSLVYSGTHDITMEMN